MCVCSDRATNFEIETFRCKCVYRINNVVRAAIFFRVVQRKKTRQNKTILPKNKTNKQKTKTKKKNPKRNNNTERELRSTEFFHIIFFFLNLFSLRKNA